MVAAVAPRPGRHRAVGAGRLSPTVAPATGPLPSVTVSVTASPGLAVAGPVSLSTLSPKAE